MQSRILNIHTMPRKSEKEHQFSFFSLGIATETDTGTLGGFRIPSVISVSLGFIFFFRAFFLRLGFFFNWSFGTNSNKVPSGISKPILATISTLPRLPDDKRWAFCKPS